VNDTLFYISAGPAAARFEDTWQDLTGRIQFADTRWGWVGTVGTEFHLSPKVSVAAELLYAQFDDAVQTGTAGGGTFAFGHNDSGVGGRILFNYHFGR
jgi:opacity protein-like surface antigen